jgi:hypothetical protein
MFHYKIQGSFPPGSPPTCHYINLNSYVTMIHKTDTFCVVAMLCAFNTFNQSRHLPLKYKERHTSRTSPLLSNNYNLLSWRTMLHNEELHNLYSSPDIIRQIKSGRMWWAGHVARMRTKSVQGFGGKARRRETTRKTKA